MEAILVMLSTESHLGVHDIRNIGEFRQLFNCYELPSERACHLAGTTRITRSTSPSRKGRARWRPSLP
jgi:hypothetical protein